MSNRKFLFPRPLRQAGAVGAFLLFVAAVATAQAPARPQAAPEAPRQAAFRAVSYDVYASLSPADQTLTAKATVEFESREPSRTLECELHSNLKIDDLRDAAGKVLPFERDYSDPLLVRVTLPEPVPAGQKTTITFAYSGPLANSEGSPVQGVRLAWIGNTGAYLLLPARWFPLTGYPSNRYTGTFHIEAPQTFAVVGTGTADAPGAPSMPSLPASADAAGGPPKLAPNSGRRGQAAANAPASTSKNGAATASARGADNQRSGAASTSGGAGASARVVSTFHVTQPEAAGTFVAGTLQLTPVKAEGLNISVYAPPTASATANAYGEAVARVAITLADRFGPLTQPNLTVAQLPEGTLSSFAAPGLLLIGQNQWGEKPNSRTLANLVAEQWWGNEVMAASPSDAWLTDGLSRYSEALYVEQAENKELMNKALDDFAVGSVMFEATSPIAEAGRLKPFSPEYVSVVANKGAVVFHMLRQQMGDPAFFALLHDFVAQYAGKAATLADFEKMAQDHAAKTASAAPAKDFVLRSSNAAADGSSSSGSSSGAASETAGGAVNLRPFFAQWLNSTGVPEFSVDYTTYRTKKGFKIVGKIKQNLDFFHMPVELEVQTEGNPEFKTVEVSGTESSFDFDVFGRPKSGGVILDPHNYILKSSQRLRVRAIIARGEGLAEQGKYYDAVQQYSQALDLQKNNSLAEFRTGEAFFYQKNYSAAANTFRDALEGDLDPSYKWVEVWSHIYLGKIYDIAGDRTRAVNEYSKAQQTNDDTGGAQAEAKKYIAQPFTEAAAQTHA